MDHTEITDRGFVELYHRGQLSPEDEERFEEHFFACEQCQQELELARSMARGFTALAREDAAGEAAPVQTAPSPAVPSAAAPDAPRSNVTSIADRRTGGVRRWLPLARAAAVTAVVMGLPLLWLGGENDRLAEQARSLRQRADEAERTAAAAGEMLAQSERRLAEERERLARRLSEEPEGTDEPGAPGPGQLAEAVPPSGPARFATAVLLLSTVRSETAAPPLLDLGAAAGPVALAVDVEDDPRFASYRLTLRDVKGRVLLAQGDVRRNALETLLVTLPPDFLRPGVHTLTVEGLAAGSAVEVGRFAFLVN